VGKDAETQIDPTGTGVGRSMLTTIKEIGIAFAAVMSIAAVAMLIASFGTF